MNIASATDSAAHARVGFTTREYIPLPAAVGLIGWMAILVGGGQALANAVSLLLTLLTAPHLRDIGMNETPVSVMMPVILFNLAAIAVGVAAFAGGVGLLRLTERGRRWTEIACCGELLICSAVGLLYFGHVVERPEYTLFVGGIVVLGPMVLALAVTLRALYGPTIRDAIRRAERADGATLRR